MFTYKLLAVPVHNTEVVSRGFVPTDLPGGCFSEETKLGT
jgi:hypothetical protein